MAGVQRVSKLVKYLPRFGWRCTVITPKPIHYYAYDNTLLADIPPETRIIRTPSLCPQRMARIALDIRAKVSHQVYRPPEYLTSSNRRFMSGLKNLLIPDEKLGWLPFALWAGIKEVISGKYQAIMTTNPPESVHLAGLALSAISGLPWVADFRDEWSRRAMRRRQPSLARWANKRLEKTVINKADLVTTVSPKMTADFAVLREMKSLNRPVTITNGFDPEALPYHDREKRGKRMVLTHVGNFTDQSSAQNFLETLAEMKTEHQDLARKLCVRFLGLLRYEDAQSVKNSHLSDVVEMCGYLPYRRALSALLESDALLLLMGEGLEDSRILLKTFEYLWARRPVLAIAPRTEGVRLLESCGVARVVAPSNKKGIKAELNRLLADFHSRNLDKPLPHINLSPFSYPYQVGNLARLLDRLEEKR
jgi:glycosyltransferase involved in cell wall biosynthesis